MCKHTKAFTLIELSIVLVVIGLIVGGVLVGRDLIAAAGVRAQLSQIEKYNTAARTFQSKYLFLPGDLPNAEIQKFGFTSYLYSNNLQDGNGDGQLNRPGSNNAYGYADTESSSFWIQLGVAKLTDFNPQIFSSYPNANETGTSIASYIPAGKLPNTYVYAWSGGVNVHVYAGFNGSDGNTYFSVANFTRWCGSNTCSGPQYSPNLRVSEAASMDKKVDDGLPQSGNVIAAVFDWIGAYSNTADDSGYPLYLPTTAATAGSSTTCYDNGNVAGVMQYSMLQDNGRGPNCALSFRFQ